MVAFLIDLANNMMDTVRDDVTGFWVPFLAACAFFFWTMWFIDEMGFLWGSSFDFSVRTFKFWVRHNWVYFIVAFWYWPRLSTMLMFADKHAPAMTLGLLAAIALFMAIVFTGRGDFLMNDLVFAMARIVYRIDYTLRGMLNILRSMLQIIRRFPLQMAALILLIVVAGSLQQPLQAEAESGQIITVEEVVNNVPQPAAQTADEPYHPNTSVSGARFVTELVTQSPIVGGHVNDAYVIVETIGAPVAVRWITEGRTAMIDVLSDEPVTIGFSAIGLAPKHTQTVKGDDEVYTHGKLFKIELPENWEDPSAVIIVENHSGSHITIDWRPN